MAKPVGELLTEWKISLPATLAAEIEILLLDAAKGKARYGARSALITSLLRQFVAQQGEENADCS